MYKITEIKDQATPTPSLYYREGVGVAWSFISVILYFVIIYCYYIIF